MAKPWDEAMKQVVAASPQTFVDWVFPGGQFIEFMNTELPKKAEEPLRADNCIAMKLRGHPCIGHVEFQSTQDHEMPERLLEYALRISRNDPHHRRVYSCVIYVRPVGEVRQSPLAWDHPDGGEVLRYHYNSLELADLEPELFLETRLAGLLPLLPLTKGGRSRQMAETMFSRIQSAGRSELIPIGALLEHRSSSAFSWSQSTQDGCSLSTKRESFQ